MSKPMMRSNPAASEVRTAPTMPPAGPDRIASLPWKRRASVRPPFDCMKKSRTPASSAGHLLDIAPQDRREIRIDHGGIAAADELHERAHAMRHRDLREPGCPRHLGDGSFVLGKAVAVHEDDGDGAITLVESGAQVGARCLEVEGKHDLAARADALGHLHHLRVQHLRQHDMAIEDARPVLVGDAQRIAEAAGNAQHRRRALALEERVGRDRGAHFHCIDLFLARSAGM